jgi:hypothetical protein
MLTDAACKKASCPEGKTRLRLPDSGGLYLEVAPNGSKRWFAKYRFEGKEKRLALGHYPDVTLKAAREGRDQARKVRAGGTDPVQKRKADNVTRAASNAVTYESAAREFHGVKVAGWSDGHGVKWLRMNELYLFPHIGSLPLSSIKTPALLATLRKVEAKGILSTAQDLQQMAGQVFRYGVQAGFCEHNPASDLKGALKPHIAQHFAAVLEPADHNGRPEVVCAVLPAAGQHPGDGVGLA